MPCTHELLLCRFWCSRSSPAAAYFGICCAASELLEFVPVLPRRHEVLHWLAARDMSHSVLMEVLPSQLQRMPGAVDDVLSSVAQYRWGRGAHGLGR